MPNYVHNIIKFNNDDNFEKIINKYINEKDDFDFNNVIEMPEELNINESSVGENGRDYLLNKNIYVSLHKDYLIDMLNNLEHENIIDYGLKNKNNLDVEEIVFIIDENIDKISKTRGSNLDIELGQKYIDNKNKYGFETWYKWSLENWGTKWNAMETYINKDLKTISFDTAWSVPVQIFEKIILENKGISFTLYYGDEGYGFAGILDFFYENNEIRVLDYQCDDKKMEDCIEYIFNENLECINNLLKYNNK